MEPLQKMCAEALEMGKQYNEDLPRLRKIQLGDRLGELLSDTYRKHKDAFVRYRIPTPHVREFFDPKDKELVIDVPKLLGYIRKICQTLYAFDNVEKVRTYLESHAVLCDDSVLSQLGITAAPIPDVLSFLYERFRYRPGFIEYPKLYRLLTPAERAMVGLTSPETRLTEDRYEQAAAIAHERYFLAQLAKTLNCFSELVPGDAPNFGKSVQGFDCLGKCQDGLLGRYCTVAPYKNSFGIVYTWDRCA